MEESTDLQYIGMKTGHANIEQMDSMRDTTETGRYDTAKARDFLKSIEEFF